MNELLALFFAYNTLKITTFRIGFGVQLRAQSVIFVKATIAKY